MTWVVIIALAAWALHLNRRLDKLETKVRILSSAYVGDVFLYISAWFQGKPFLKAMAYAGSSLVPHSTPVSTMPAPAF